ncbi:hypothetical protein KZ498_14495 [Haloarcula sp. 1CSR25-25]|nr:hypothetical protein [Haloarcula sp. 1CSR25-25]
MKRRNTLHLDQKMKRDGVGCLFWSEFINPCCRFGDIEHVRKGDLHIGSREIQLSD